MEKKKNRGLGNISLLVATFIWGSAFVAQSEGAKYIGTFTFNASRTLIAITILTVIVYIRNYRQTKRWFFWKDEDEKKLGRIKPLFGGTALFFAMTLQQEGMKYTTAGKAGFLTTLYMIMVPVFGLFLHKRVKFIQWLGVFMALVGVALLSLNGVTGINIGDVMIIGAALFFAIDILMVDHLAQGIEPMRLSIFRFIPCLVLSTVVAIFTETTSISDFANCSWTLFYTGVLSSAVAYTLQIVAQRETDTITASILMSFEAVFALLSGYVVLGEKITIREGVGCIIMFIAALIVQLNGEKEGAIDGGKDELQIED